MKLEYENHDEYSLYLRAIKGDLKGSITIELLKIEL